MVLSFVGAASSSTDHGGGKRGPSMQTLMHDQQQPACDRPKNNSGERGDRDYDGGPTQALPERPLGRERHFSGYLALCLPQSSSASRFTAGAFGFLTFTQCAERPER